MYALLLLSDALFWNCFGFDRSAVQVYFLAPVKLSTVLAGKNLAAVMYVLLEIIAIAIVCALLRLPLSVLQILEAFSVTCVVTLFILSIGNLSSFYNPRAVNPVKSFRTGSSGRTQAMLMLAFPVALIPVALAYPGALRFRFRARAVRRAAGWRGAGRADVYLLDGVGGAGRRRAQGDASSPRLSQGEGPIES